jgi:hypothetical protein
MSSTTRAYVKGDDPMYRSVTPVPESPLRIAGVRYAGPYTTVGAAKRSRGPGGWVEVCRPVWEKLED